MRFPHVINANTREAYAPSPAALNLIRERNRRVFPENLEWGDDRCPSLVTFCVIAISKHFPNNPLLAELPEAERDQLLEILPTDLSLDLVVPLIDDEYYWERRFSDKYGLIVYHLNEDWTWKTVFMERYMQQVVEEAQPQYRDEYEMEETTKLCCPYVKRLIVSQLQAWKPPLNLLNEELPEENPIDHINFEPILKVLVEVEELDIIYGMKGVAESLKLSMFKVSILDCKRLGNAVLFLENIKILRLHRSKVGDEHIQVLMQGLIKNKTLVELDLSHCLVADRGALCIAKVMTEHPTLERLILTNNRIKKVGAEGIGWVLWQDCCCPLLHLNLRLNPLEHEGVMGILRALVRVDKLKELNVSGCYFEDDTGLRVSQLIALNRSLELLDISNNWVGEEHGEKIAAALKNNPMIKWMDIRETDISSKDEAIIQKLLLRNLGKEDEEEVEEEEQNEALEEESEVEINKEEAENENENNETATENKENAPAEQKNPESS